MRRSSMLAALALVCSAVHGQGLSNAQPTLTVGNWTTLASIDAMTDKVRCTGVYKSDYSVQVGADALYIRVRGGVDTVTLRFGDQPPKALRLASRMEKDLGSVIIENSDFQTAQETNRLRVQVLTILKNVVTLDLDTTGLQETAAHIRAGCPLGAKPNAAKAPASEKVACTPQLIERLRSVGVTDEQIAGACSR